MTINCHRVLTLCDDAGAASEQGANTGTQAQKKKRRVLLVNLNRGAEPKTPHVSSDTAVSLVPEPIASSHHAVRAQTGGQFCNMVVLEPVQGKLLCSC